MRIFLYTLLVGSLAFLSGCESMEDSYSEFDPSTRSRATGKCYDMLVKSGWKRVKVDWKNSEDPTIKEIKLKWFTTEIADSVILSPDVVTYTTPTNLDNTNYTFELTAVSAEGVPSIVERNFIKPYAEGSEELSSFSVLHRKFFKVGTDLIVKLSTYSELIQEARISYYSGGEPKYKILEKSHFDDTYLRVENVDMDKAVMVHNISRLPDCFDNIVFEPYELGDGFNFDPDFAAHLLSSYSMKEITNEWKNNIETLELDYSLNSLEDLLSFPNLKHLVIGSKRYVHADYTADKLSALSDLPTSLLAMEMMVEINGLDVTVYNDQYGLVSKDLPYVSDGGDLIEPSLDLFDMQSWKVECNTTEEEDNSHPEWILNDDINLAWTPTQSETIRKHELVIDMQEEKTISGFRFCQPEASFFNAKSFTNGFQVFVSEKGNNWEDAFSGIDNIIGEGRGETTILNLSEEKTVRYIKVVVYDRDGSTKYTYMGEFVPFK